MSEIKVDTLTGKTSAGDITVTSEGGAATMQLQQGLAKAWINFDLTSPTSSRDSFNISSLTDAAVGQTNPISFTNNMSNADYSGSHFANATTGGTTSTNFANSWAGGFGSFTTSSFGASSYDGSYTDGKLNFNTIVGDLA